MVVALIMDTQSFLAAVLPLLNWIIPYFPQSWKFLFFFQKSYFVDIQHKSQKYSMIQVAHRWIIPIE